MNRNLDGTELSTAQLRALALADGADPVKLTGMLAALHGANASRSHLLQLTTTIRFAMFDRGELLLDTRPLPRPPFKPAEVDAEVFEFLTGRIACPTP